MPRKGVDNVIRALGVLVRRLGVPAELLVVGGNSDIAGPGADAGDRTLAGRSGRGGVADRVTFTGRRPRELLKLYYSAADAFVTTPWYESFGMTPIEAMACGTPVVGARVGGIKYSVVDGRTGFLVPPNDPWPSPNGCESLLLAAARGTVRGLGRAARAMRCSVGSAWRTRSPCCTPVCTARQWCPTPRRMPVPAPEPRERSGGRVSGRPLLAAYGGAGRATVPSRTRGGA